MRRVELLSGMAGRRRSCNLEQKLAIVSEARGCDNLTELAQRHDMRTSQLYTWRRELRYALEAAGTRNTIVERHFVPVVTHREERPRSDATTIKVEFDGAVVRISRTAEARQITAVVQALRQTRYWSRYWRSRDGRNAPGRFPQRTRRPGGAGRRRLWRRSYSGGIYVFRAKRSDRIKLVWWDGTGLCLMAKKIKQGGFKWPGVQDGVIRLTAAQLGALLEGLDWRRVHCRRRPQVPQIAG